MCGITGIFSNNPQDVASEIEVMTQALSHRGPDGQGIWVDPEGRLALGHTRLAILDLSPTGTQPMVCASGRFAMTYNGELYNCAELRRDLPGHVWRGTSDTEVFLEHAARFGLITTLNKANGMFALALWDREERTLCLARDRFGIKPLIWSWRPGLFLFGSEMRAIESHPRFQPSLEPAALDACLRRSYIPAPLTIWREAKKLLPGHCLRIGPDTGNEPVLEAWWSSLDVARQGLSRRGQTSEDQLLDEMDALLQDAVQRQLVADVPVGAFLSGGIDSSSVVAAIHRAQEKGLKTFTIRFAEAAYDEGDDAAKIAGHLGTDHHELFVSANDALAVVPDLANIYDEPFADSSQIPTLLLSRFARKSVKVVLSGDGGDELFAGYNRHLLAASYLPRLEQQPLWLRRLGANVLNNLPPAFLDRLGSLAGIRQAGEKSRKLSAILPLAEDFGATYDCLTCQGLGSGETLLADPDDSFYRAADPSSPDFDFLDQMLLRDTKTYLPGDILVKLDRASMSVGLEARVPLLDHRLYELAWTLPNSLKAAGGAGKIALRRILGRHLPSSLFDGKPKMGFAVPLDTWLTGPLRTWAEDLLAPESLKRNGFLDAKRCLQMWQDHKSGRCKRHHTLWNLLMLLSWLVGRRGA